MLKSRDEVMQIEAVSFLSLSWLSLFQGSNINPFTYKCEWTGVFWTAKRKYHFFKNTWLTNTNYKQLCDEFKFIQWIRWNNFKYPFFKEKFVSVIYGGQHLMLTWQFRIAAAGLWNLHLLWQGEGCFKGNFWKIASLQGSNAQWSIMPSKEKIKLSRWFIF